MKRMLFTLALAALLTLALPCLADTATGWSYTVNANGEAVISKYTGSDTHVVVPEELNGHPVTSIGSSAFSKNTTVEEIDIPDCVTGLGSWQTFMGATSLQRIRLSQSITAIPDNAFNGCKALTAIDIPGSVKSIGVGAFYGCWKLTDVTFHEGLESIGDQAFYNCKLHEIRFPDTLNSIGREVLGGSIHGDNIIIAELGSDLSCFLSGKGYSITDPDYPQFEFRNWVDSEGKQNVSLEYADETLSEVVIPDFVTSLANVFRSKTPNAKNTALTSVTIPESVTSISGRTFADCVNLISVELPDSITTMDGSIFSGCESLTDVKLPKDLKTLPYSLFWECTSLKEVDLPENLEKIWGAAFQHCTALTKIDIPESVTYIGPYNFEGCISLTEVRLPKGLEDLFYEAFQGSGIYSLTIPEGITKLDDKLCQGCENLTTVVLPSGLTEIADTALPDSVKTVYGYGGTVAETWADEHDCRFIDLSDPGSAVSPTLQVPDHANLDKGERWNWRSAVSIAPDLGGEPIAITAVSNNPSVAEVDGDYLICHETGEALLTILAGTADGNNIPGRLLRVRVWLPVTDYSVPYCYYVGESEQDMAEDKVRPQAIQPEGANPEFTFYYYSYTDGYHYFTGDALQFTQIPDMGSAYMISRSGIKKYFSVNTYQEYLGFTFDGPSFKIHVGDSVYPNTYAHLKRGSYDDYTVSPAPYMLSSSNHAVLAPIGGDSTGFLALAPGQADITVTDFKNKETKALTFTVHDIRYDLILPEDAVVIRSRAFAGATFESVYLPQSCTSIEPRAFEGNRNLNRVYIANPYAIEIASDAFYGCWNVTLDVPVGTGTALLSRLESRDNMGWTPRVVEVEYAPER